MKPGNAIEVNNITKKFKVYLDKGRTLKELALFSNRRKHEEREVLRGISFEVKKGEAVGLIGHNGCGKSTTLKLLTKIMYPDSGNIEMIGRVSSLIELGAGFHPDMSGRQNIYTNASIFGLTRREIEDRLDAIIAFSELEEFIDNPVRTYSSGMYMRLAFSVAINVDADILLIDEILAVGDANFQSKCFNKLRELKASGLTIVIVSHDTGVIEKFCGKAIWINEGKIISSGKSSIVVDDYLKYMNDKKVFALQQRENINPVENKISINSVIEEKNKVEIKPKKIDYESNHFGLGYVTIESAYFLNNTGKKTSVLEANEPVDLIIEYKVNKPLEEYIFGMGIFDLDGKCIIGCNTKLDRICIPHKTLNGKIKYHIKKLVLLSGKYILNVAIVDSNETPQDFYRDYCHFEVISKDRSIGIVSLEHNWEII